MTSELKTNNSRFRGTASVLNEISRLGRHFIGLLVVGVLIGLACLPLNLVDRIQECNFSSYQQQVKPPGPPSVC